MDIVKPFDRRIKAEQSSKDRVGGVPQGGGMTLQAGEDLTVNADHDVGSPRSRRTRSRVRSGRYGG